CIIQFSLRFLELRLRLDKRFPHSQRASICVSVFFTCLFKSILQNSKALFLCIDTSIQRVLLCCKAVNSLLVALVSLFDGFQFSIVYTQCRIDLRQGGAKAALSLYGYVNSNGTILRHMLPLLPSVLSCRCRRSALQ